MSVSTLNTILILVFVLVILASILAGLIGFLKGIYKTSLKTVLKTALVLVLVFTSPSIAVLVGNVNIQGLVHSESAITLQTWIANLITETGFFSPVNGIQIYSMAIAIATSLLSFAVFLVGMILIQLFISLLTFIVYHGVFSWFIPVETPKERKNRKKHKEAAALKNGIVDEDNNILKKPRKKWSLFRIPSSIIGGIQEFVFVLILLTPFVSLASTALDNRDSINNALKTMDVSDENQDLFNSYLDSIDSSLIYKMISFSKLDTSLINKATSVNVNGSDISFNVLVSSSLDLANPLMENGTISYDDAAKKLTINYSSLLSIATVDGVVDTLLANPMLLSLLPPLLDSAINSISGDYFALSSLDFSNIDYSSEITALKDIYSIVYESGIKPLLNENKFDFQNYVMKVTQFTDDDIASYALAMKEFGNMEVVKKNLPSLLASLGVYLNQKGYNIFPTQSSYYENIDWSEDLSVLTTIALKFFRMIGMDITSHMDVNELKNNIVKALKDSSQRKQLKEFICSSDDSKGILDTGLFSVLSLADILSSSFATVPALSSYSKQIDYESLFSGYTSSDYKKEINVIFDLLDNIFSEDSKIDIEHIFASDYSDEDTSSQFVSLLRTAKNSKIFSSMYPSLMKALLFNDKFDFSDYLFGLTPYNFNYDSENFIDDFISLIEIMPEVASMMNNLTDSSLSRSEKIQSLDTAVIEKLLTIVTSSDFFNSDQLTGTSSNKQKNMNIQTLLSNFLSNDLFSSFEFVIPDIEKMQNIDWSGSSNFRGEIAILCQIIEDMKDNATFFSSSNLKLKDIEDTASFTDAVKNGLQSEILNESILKVIDNSLNRYLEKMGIHLSLSEMRTELWIEDCDDLGDLLSILQEFDFDGLNLDNLDLNLLNAFLTKINQMNLVHATSVSRKDDLGHLIYMILSSNGIGKMMDVSSVSESTFLLDDVGQWSTEITIYEYHKSALDGSDIVKTMEITTEGEIHSLLGLLGIIREVGTSAFSSGVVPSTFFEQVSDYLVSPIVRNILSIGLSSMISHLNIPSEFDIFLKSIDFSYFAQLDESSARKEIQLISDLTEYLQKMPDSDETYFSYLLSNILQLQNTKSILSDDDVMTMEDDLDHILDEISSSVLMNRQKDGYALTPAKNFLKAVVKKVGLMDGVTLSKDSIYSDYVLDAILLDVSSNDIVNEMTILKSLINTLQGYQFDINIGQDIPLVTMQTVLKEMNASSLFHRYPIFIIRNSLDKLGIDEYLVDPDDGSIRHPLNYLTHLTSSKDDVSYWQNDIDMLLKIAYDENSIGGLFKEDKNLNSISLTSSGLSLDFIYYLGNMNLLKANRCYIIYNLIKQSCPNGFDFRKLIKKSSKTPYGENEYVYRLEELFFDNVKLLDSQSVMIKEKAINDLGMLKNVLTYLLDNVERLSSEKNLSFDFRKLMDYCLQISGEDFYRSDLCSELVAGATNVLAGNSNYSTYMDHISSLDFYDNDYYLINPIEGDAINGIIMIVNKDVKSGDAFFSLAELSELIPCFGRKTLELASDDYDLYYYFQGQSSYQNASYNSQIGMKLKEVIFSLPVLKIGDTLPIMLSEALSLDENYLLTNTYQDIISKASNILQ